MDDDGKPIDGEVIDFRSGRSLKNPIRYSDALAAEIAETYATTSKSITTLCATNRHWPSFQTLYGWRLKYPIFDQAMWLAQKMRAAAWVDEAVEIADDMTRDIHNGEPNPVAVARSKIRSDFRIKGAKLLDPETFGDRVEVRQTAAYLPQDEAIKYLK